MKKGIILSLVLLLIIFMGCGKSSDKPADTADEKTGYAVGYDLAARTGLKEISEEIDVDTLIQGLSDALNDKEAKIKLEEREEILRQFRLDMTRKHQEKRNKLGEKNKVEGKAFLEKNAKKEGVKTTASGLQYEVIKEGTGPSPKAEDKVKVHYRGTLIDGTEFDSSYNRGEPALFVLKGVIKGWVEGVQLMKVGAKYRFAIPPELAYGERGAGVKIGPHAVLIFEIELISIESPGPEKN